MGMNDTPSGERVHIGFFGRRNAGKSSVVNAVTGQDLSIVSATKGTTTDPVYKAMELLPLGPVVIIDTPGFDDGHAFIFIILDFLAPGNIGYDGQAVFIGKGLDQFVFIVDIAPVEDDALDLGIAAALEVFDGLDDIGRCVEGHLFAGRDDEDFIGIAIADGRREAAADDVAQDVI